MLGIFFFGISSGYIYLHIMYFYFLFNRERTNAPRCVQFSGCVCTCVCVVFSCVCVYTCVCVLKSSEEKIILRSLGLPTDEQDGGRDMHAAGCAEAGTHTHTA
jgi:hypothetical protein